MKRKDVCDHHFVKLSYLFYRYTCLTTITTWPDPISALAAWRLSPIQKICG